jgi:carboxypeptidase Taq
VESANPIDGFDALVAGGDLAPIREWLRTKIHNVGSLHPSADELCEAVTGAKLDPAIYVAHLNKKYSKLYNVAE